MFNFENFESLDYLTKFCKNKQNHLKQKIVPFLNFHFFINLFI